MESLGSRHLSRFCSREPRLAENLHVIDFEQLKIENQQLNVGTSASHTSCGDVPGCLVLRWVALGCSGENRRTERRAAQVGASNGQLQDDGAWSCSQAAETQQALRCAITPPPASCFHQLCGVCWSYTWAQAAQKDGRNRADHYAHAGEG